MAQNPKGGGLSSAFGGASSAQFGVQRTNDFMEKSTWTLGITIVVLIVLGVVLTAKPTETIPTAPAKKESKTSGSTNNTPTTNTNPTK